MGSTPNHSNRWGDGSKTEMPPRTAPSPRPCRARPWIPTAFLMSAAGRAAKHYEDRHLHDLRRCFFWTPAHRREVYDTSHFPAPCPLPPPRDFRRWLQRPKLSNCWLLTHIPPHAPDFAPACYLCAGCCALLCAVCRAHGVCGLPFSIFHLGARLERA